MRRRMRPRASSLVDVKAGPRPILRTRPSSLAGPRVPVAFSQLLLGSKFNSIESRRAPTKNTLAAASSYCENSAAAKSHTTRG
jgi:hypothetical protein